MRVQFTVNENEWKKLEDLAKQEGYPDIPSYCKDIALNERTYQKLWQTVVKKIAEKQKGEVFALRDLVSTPPANLGVKLYENQKKLNIELNKKDKTKTNTFIKL